MGGLEGGEVDKVASVTPAVTRMTDKICNGEYLRGDEELRVSYS